MIRNTESNEKRSINTIIEVVFVVGFVMVFCVLPYLVVKKQIILLNMIRTNQLSPQTVLIVEPVRPILDKVLHFSPRKNIERMLGDVLELGILLSIYLALLLLVAFRERRLAVSTVMLLLYTFPTLHLLDLCFHATHGRFREADSYLAEAIFRSVTWNLIALLLIVPICAIFRHIFRKIPIADPSLRSTSPLFREIRLMLLSVISLVALPYFCILGILLELYDDLYVAQVSMDAFLSTDKNTLVAKTYPDISLISLMLPVFCLASYLVIRRKVYQNNAPFAAALSMIGITFAFAFVACLWASTDILGSLFRALVWTLLALLFGLPVFPALRTSRTASAPRESGSANAEGS